MPIRLDYREHAHGDPTLLRPVDITETLDDATKARRERGWRTTVTLIDLDHMMVDAEVDWLKGGMSETDLAAR